MEERTLWRRSLLLAVQHDAGDLLSASHIGNLTDLQRAFDSERPLESAGFTYTIGRPYQRIEHELFKVGAWWLTGNAGKLSVTGARQYNLRYEFDKHLPLNDSLAGLNLPQLQFEITSHTADVGGNTIVSTASPAASGSAGCGRPTPRKAASSFQLRERAQRRFLDRTLGNRRSNWNSAYATTRNSSAPTAGCTRTAVIR